MLWVQSATPLHMSEMEPGVVRFTAATGITEGTWLPPALSSNRKDKNEFIAFPVHAVVFMFILHVCFYPIAIPILSVDCFRVSAHHKM